MQLIQKIDDLIEPLRKLASHVGAPLWDLAARVYLGYEFFKSGMLRFNDWKNGSFDNQVFLFDLEHPVPGLMAETAAYVTTAAEIILPVFLITGLFGRFAAGGLLVMAAIIELTYLHSPQHILWIFLASALLIRGPGILSLDYLVLKAIRKTE